MADLEEILETPRTDIDSDLNHEETDLAPRNTRRRKRSKKSRNSNGAQSPVQPSPPDKVSEESRKVVENRERQADSAKYWGATPTQEDSRARFYEDYRKVAEEYDKEFLKKHDEDLNTTLIFAGLFSAVTSAFIIQVDSQLQPSSSDETNALLRVLLSNMTLGNNLVTVTQNTKPPSTLVHVQAILFASLSASLFSAFLAMLGKQWLNRYESTDKRGSAIERSHGRQRKLNGIVRWYFNHVMESLPLMLQAALLLLGCALSRYLWGIDTAIALVVLCATSFGAFFYLFIVIAGAASESFPYQTPAAHVSRYILRHLRDHLLPTLRSIPATVSAVISSNLSYLYQVSWSCSAVFSWWSDNPWINIIKAIMFPVLLYGGLLLDGCHIGLVMIRSLVASGIRVRRQLLGSHKIAYRWFTEITSLRTPGPDQQTIIMDLRCISWTLQTSLDKSVHLSAFRHLTSMPHLARFHSTLVVDCFNIFTRCISVSNGKVAIIQGFEQLATASADAFFRILHYLATTDPNSSILADLQRHYKEVFPSELDFTGLPFDSTMTEIHNLAGRFGNPRDIRWHKYKMSTQEHIPFAQHMLQTAQEGYERTQRRKVPRWILRSALYFLSLGPVSQPPVVADCLTIVATDLDCELPEATVSDESARVEDVSNLITQKLDTMVESDDPGLIISKRKAINTLLPYAIFLEQIGQQGMIDAILRAAKVSDSDPRNHGKFMWRHVVLYTSRLFEKRSPASLNRVITLISPFVPWDGALNNPIAVSRWAAAASTVPYTNEVGQSVVNTLFQIAYIDLLGPYIPFAMWRWMRRRPSLPPVYHGLPKGACKITLAHVRRLKDVDLLKSFFLLIWTDRCILPSTLIHEAEISIREDLTGVEAEHHREVLIERLDYVLEQLGQMQESSMVRKAKSGYERLRDVLLEIQKR